MKFAVLVESTKGFFRMEEIARCHPRIVSLSLGSEDFAADAGMQSEPEALFLSEAAYAVRRARRRDHADGICRLNRRFSRPGCIPCDRTAVAPPGVCRRQRDPSLCRSRC